MEVKSVYKLSYLLDRELKEFVLQVELRQVEGIPKKGQNVWEGIATLNGLPYDKEDLTHCVNARIAAERIGKRLRDDLKSTAKTSGQSFRIKKEEIK
jgi:hypothetical protein